MNNKRKWIYGIAAATVIVVTLNIDKTSIVNAANQLKGRKTTTVVLGDTR